MGPTDLPDDFVPDAATALPDDFVPDNPANVISGLLRTQRALGGLGSAPMSDAQIAAKAQAGQAGLARFLDPMMRSLSDVSAPGAPPAAQQPQYSGQEAAQAALDPQNIRDAAITAGATAGSVMMPEVGVPAALGRFGPPLMRAAGAMLGGAGGSLATEPVAQTEDPLKSATEAAVISLAGEGAGAVVSKGARSLGRFARTIMPDADAAAKTFVDKYLRGASPEEVHALTIDALNESAATHREVAQGMYQQVDQRLGKALVDPDTLLDQAAKYRQKYPRSEAVRSIAQRIEDAYAGASGSKLSFAEAQQLRTELLAGRATGGTEAFHIPGQAEGVAKSLAGTLDQAMSKAAKEMDPAAYDLWRKANQFWKEGKTVFNGRMLKSLADADPGKIYEMAIKNRSPAMLGRLQKVIDNPATWDKLKGLAAHDLFEGVTRDGVVDGAALLRRITDNKGAYGPTKLKMLFGEGGVSNLEKIARSLKATQAADRALPLTWADGVIHIGLRPAMAVVAGAAVGGLRGAEAMSAISIAPPLFTKLLENESFSRWVSLGLRAPAGSGLAQRAFSQIAAQVAAAQLEAPQGEEP